MHTVEDRSVSTRKVHGKLTAVRTFGLAPADHAREGAAAKVRRSRTAVQVDPRDTAQAAEELELNTCAGTVFVLHHGVLPHRTQLVAHAVCVGTGHPLLKRQRPRWWRRRR